MNPQDGFYWIPVLPRELAEKLKALPQDEAKWPSEFKAEYHRLRKDFTKAKAEYASWIRKDRDSRMKGNAKAVAAYVLDCLNFETGRCDPSHHAIADEVGLSIRTVERMMQNIRLSGWFEVVRRGKTTTNFYRFRVPVAKISALLDHVDDLRQMRAEARENRNSCLSDPTKLTGHLLSDPTTVRSHEPSELSGHEPSELSGKYMNRTPEGEHLNKGYCSEGGEDTNTRGGIAQRATQSAVASNPSGPQPQTEERSNRQKIIDVFAEQDGPVGLGGLVGKVLDHLPAGPHRIPTEEASFGRWIKENIPDPMKHREALQLLRDRRMTPEALRRLAA